MFAKSNFSTRLGNRPGRLLLMASVVLFAAACGSSTLTPATLAPSTQNPAATSAAVIIPSLEPTQAGPASNSASIDICATLTNEDISQALGVKADSVQRSSTGGVCNYTSANLSMDLTYSHTGGVKAMNTTLANLGDMAQVVPGLGDQAFYNTNSANALFVLKGDGEYLFQLSDLTYQPLDPTIVQAAEKALAEILVSKLP
jgi:hypothetical protein